MISSLTDAFASFLPSAAASVAAPAVQGAALGALGSGLSGGNPLNGALIGGVGGGALGAFGGANGAVANLTGLGGQGSDALIGALTGGAGSALTGGNPLAGALAGGLAGYGYGSTSNGSNTSSGLGPYDMSPTGQMAPTSGGSVQVPGYDVNAQEAAKPGGGSAAPAVGAANNIINGGKNGAGGLNNTSAALGLLATLGSALSKPKATTIAQMPGAAQNPNTGALWNAPLNTNVPGRTPTNPWPTGSAPSYWSYGGPEATYFNNNSLKSFGFAHGGEARGALGMADGGDGEFSTANGEHYVRGAGDGTSDDVPAKLSDGEYVLTAADVARLGNGSNEAGAKRLDQFRDDLAKKAGQKKFIPKAAGGALQTLTQRAA